MALTKATNVGAYRSFYLPTTLASERTLEDKVSDTLSVLDFGAKGDGTTDDALAFQTAIREAKRLGKSRVFVPTPAVYYRITYPVFLLSGIELFGTGPGCRLVFENPVFSKGRGAIVIGSSYEINRDKVFEAYDSGVWAGKSTINTSYVNPAQKQYIRDNPQFIECQGASVHDLRIDAVYFAPYTDGGYGVNFVNAQDCQAYNISGSGWTQLIGMGSDTPPETPSNHRCVAFNLDAIRPNQTKTYYSIGFISNCTNCKIHTAVQHEPMANGSPNGSAAAFNLCEDCEIYDITVHNLGRTVSSEGVLLNNLVGCRVENICIKGTEASKVISAVSHYYTDSSFNVPSRPNIIKGVTAVNCDHAISLRGKYVVVDDVDTYNCTYDLYLGNNNATNNDVRFKPETIRTGGTNLLSWFLQNNKVAGWKRKYTYYRPAAILLNSKADTTSWNNNKLVSTKLDVDLSFQVQIPEDCKAIDDMRCFLRFNNAADAAFTKGSTVKMSLDQMIAFDGNIGEVPYTALQNTRVASSGMENTTLVSTKTDGLGLILLDDATNGLANAWFINFNMTLNVSNNYMKEIRVAGYY